jgi:DNA-directed RNA polymerase II subunit RPB9
MTGPKLRFCPESNDLLYPKEDRDRKKLVYICRSCGYKEDADPSEWCVYRNEVHHTSREKSVVLQVRRAAAAAAAAAHLGLRAVPSA